MFTVLMNGGNEGRPPLTLDSLRFIVRMAFKARLNPASFASARNLIAEDGENHASMRAIVNRGFTPRRIAEWEPRIRQIVEECRPSFASDAFDVMHDLAIPLPVTVIAEMLGVEHSRLADFKRWSDGIIEFATGPGRAERFSREASDIFCEFANYLRTIAEERRRHPKDDLVSVIVASGEGEAALDTREIIQFALLLLVAGNETTTNLIGNGANALLDHPDSLARIAEDTRLVPSLIEETLRFDAPIQTVFRTATRDVALHGGTIRAGQNVGLLLGSANRDERRFPDPDRFDLDRNPQGHVGFGFGHHFCLGASLARLEASAAFEALVPELPRFARTGPEPPMVESFIVRGRRQLPLHAAA
jgi:cytochrome P450